MYSNNIISMDYFSSIVTLFLFSVPINAQNDNNTSITQAPWFWPLLGVLLALLIIVPCICIVIVAIYYGKRKLIGSFDESSINSRSSSASLQHGRYHRHSSHRPSHHARGFRSPPPPYTTSDPPQTLSVISSLPPSYEPHINENISTDTSPVTNAQSTANAQIATLDVSTTLANQSIETFHL